MSDGCIVMKYRKCCLIVLGIAASIALVIYLGYEFDRWLDPFDDEPFNQAVWATSENNHQLRGPMARDVMKRLPPGTAKSRVKQLLGKPDSDSWMSEHRFDLSDEGLTSGGEYTYRLGGWSAIGWYGFDSAWLAIYFDTNGNVIWSEIDGG